VRHASLPPSQIARAFVRALGFSLVALGSLATTRAEDRPSFSRSESRVEWARLITHSGFSDRHADGDAIMVDLLRSHTGLNIVPAWSSVDPGNLEELCRRPFVYADNIANLAPRESSHLAEYFRRGGFLLIDCCTNIAINPDPDQFLAQQLRVIQRDIPDARVAVLRPTHPIYSIYFSISERPPQTRQRGWTAQDGRPLHAVLVGDRTVAIITLNGFQCGWTSPKLFRNATESVKMAMNIYVYAMTHSAEPDPRMKSAERNVQPSQQK
jgi:hypothetical protein